MWLTAEEVEDLTDKVRWKAQCRELAKLGIPFQPNAKGRPLVRRALFEKDREKSRPHWGKAA